MVRYEATAYSATRSMPKTLLILYTGNVGSSPLLCELAKQSTIFSCFYEELDKFQWVTKGYDKSDHFIDYFKCAFDPRQVFDLQIEASDDFYTNISERLKKYNNEKCNIFKWRPWYGDEASRVVSESNSEIILPLRCSIIEAALRRFYNMKFAKKYLGIDNCLHLQFHFTRTKMSDSEYAKYFNLMKEFTFLLSEDEMQEFQELLAHLVHTASFLIDYAMNLGNNVTIVRASSITQNLRLTSKSILDKFQIKNDAVDMKGAPINFRKAGMINNQQCQNLDKVLSYGKVKGISERYRSIVDPYLRQAL